MVRATLATQIPKLLTSLHNNAALMSLALDRLAIAIQIFFSISGLCGLRGCKSLSPSEAS